MSPTPFIDLYDTHDLENKIKVTKILSFLKVIPMIYLIEFSQNLAIGSQDRVQTRLFHSYTTTVTLKLQHQNLIIS